MDHTGLVDEPKHKYMVPFLKSMPAAMSDKFINNYLADNPVQIEVPSLPFNWKMIIGQAKPFFSVNFLPFLMFTCGGIAAFHFAQIITRIGKNKQQCHLALGHLCSRILKIQNYVQN